MTNPKWFKQSEALPMPGVPVWVEASDRFGRFWMAAMLVPYSAKAPKGKRGRARWCHYPQLGPKPAPLPRGTVEAWRFEAPRR